MTKRKEPLTWCRDWDVDCPSCGTGMQAVYTFAPGMTLKRLQSWAPHMPSMLEVAAVKVEVYCPSCMYKETHKG